MTSYTQPNIISIIIIINIYIAQIPCEYVQMRVTNMIQIKHNKLRFPTGGRLTSWLFTKRGGVEFGPPKTNPSSGREGDLNPGPPDFKSSALPLGHARLHKYLKYINRAILANLQRRSLKIGRLIVL